MYLDLIVSSRTIQQGSVPTELGALTGLPELDLRENAITSVPTELGSLTSLTLMNLRDNQISEL